jgi:hypothetical protein
MTERTRALDFAEAEGHRAWLVARQATFDSWKKVRAPDA